MTDCPIGSLKAGTHTISMYADCFNNVSESDGSDNQYSRSLVILPVNSTPVIKNLPDLRLDQNGNITPVAGVSALAALSGLDNVSASDPAAARVAVGSDGDANSATAACGIEDEIAQGIYKPEQGDDYQSGVSYRTFDAWGGTWSDCEKSTSAPNDNLCWAASASNDLVWTEWGLAGGMTNSDAVFQYFTNHWTDVGGNPMDGWNWWFDGVNPDGNQLGWSQLRGAAGGKFYPTLNPDNYITYASTDSQLMSTVDQYCRNGMGVALSLGSDSGGGHSITCWGFNYDPSLSPSNPAYYKGVWVTDSDDNDDVSVGSSAPDVLHYYAVVWNSAKGRYDVPAFGADVYMNEVEGLLMKPGTPGDLWSYTRDGESADSQLTFSITGNTDAGCGVSIVANRTLQFKPTANWYGCSNVTVQVTDGYTTTTDTFRVMSKDYVAPTFTLTGPTSGTFTAGQIVPILWTATNAVAGSSVALCYDKDTVWGNGNETWITFGQPAATAGSYNWNTTGLAPGTYYVAGYLWSGGNRPTRT